MKHKTATLSGVLLEAAVAKAEGHTGIRFYEGGAIGEVRVWTEQDDEPCFSSSWCSGGPIIERERIYIEPLGEDEWWAGYDNWCSSCSSDGARKFNAPTPLVAAMRAYVAGKFGEEVELP